MNSIVVKEKKKAFPYFIKKEKTDKARIFKIYDERKTTAKRLCKIMEKEKIVNVAFDRSVSASFKEYFKGRINIITKQDVLFSNVDKIILKATGMLGIKDGKLTLGIITGYKTDILIRKLESIRNKLKVLYLFNDNVKENTCYADLYYKSTGVPVVVSGEIKNTGCDIYVYLGNKEIGDYTCDGLLIDISGKISSGGVKDVKIDFVNTENNYNISDGVFAKVFDRPFNISGFITKNT